MNSQMEVDMENPGCVCVYNWVDSPRATRHFHCMDDNDQQQQDEICALEAIYAENFEL